MQHKYQVQQSLISLIFKTFVILTYQIKQQINLINQFNIRPHHEYASAPWDPYTAHDSHQLDKAQHRAGCSMICQKETTSVSETYLLVTMAVTRRTQEKNARLSVFYKGLHGPRE